MPISTPGKEILSSAIEKAFKKSKEDGTADGANPQNIVQSLANEIAAAIDDYIKKTVVTINPGIAVSVTGTSTAQTGVTTGTGTS